MNAVPRIWAVVVAAGAGQRMGRGVPKVYRELCGQPVLGWSCGAFLDHPQIVAVQVVHAADDPYLASLPQLGHDRLWCVTGGQDRAASVEAGLKALLDRGADATDWVLVHDGARPCIDADDISAVINAAHHSEGQGALLALPVTDTLKRHLEGVVTATVDRAPLARALTPQCFPCGDLLAALTAARADNQPVTDEAGAMEQAGFRPRLVWGRASNLKITYPDDLQVAAFWLSRTAARP